MSKMKKVLLASVAGIIVVAMAIGGTIAYLTSEDGAANVMTLGNVEIQQIEQERIDGTSGQLIDNLKDFSQDKPAFPYTGGSDYDFSDVKWNNDRTFNLFTTDNNAIDKFISVKNTGKSSAYVRTLVAFEVGTDANDAVAFTAKFNETEWSVEWLDELVEFEGVYYKVAEVTYGDELQAGETTLPSLLQVYLDSSVDNDDVARLGETWEIYAISQAVQTAGFDEYVVTYSVDSAALACAMHALDESFGEATVENTTEWFETTAAEFAVDTWDGTADTSWYNDTDTEFVLKSAEQFAGFAKLVDDGNSFDGKTIKLSKSVDLAGQLFNPIGSYRKELVFSGTFDGQGKTISNLSQNTWELNTGYYYGDLGLGLFSCTENATIKNLTIDGADISGESAICGTLVACAYGDSVFENITISNANVADYQYYAGGMVGWASGNHQYINCNIDATTTVAAQWGDFDNSTGGVIGGCGGSAKILLKDCTVACRVDVYNDVTSTYQWYAYRRAGMLIGNPGKTTTTASGSTVAAAPQLTCENVTVIYGDWANYHYCKFAGTSWPYVRVEEGISNSAYSNPRYGHPTDANGNTVIDDNHVHNEGEAHMDLHEFDQLYGGGQGVYGTATHDGVTVIYNNK